MYHGFRTSEQGQHMHRFLWKDGYFQKPETNILTSLHLKIDPQQACH